MVLNLWQFAMSLYKYAWLLAIAAGQMQSLLSFHLCCGSNITTQIGTNLQALLTQKRKKKSTQNIKSVPLYLHIYTRTKLLPVLIKRN